VPRAKRTNRADARRRYRASVAQPIDDDAESSAEPGAAPAAASGSGRTTTPATSPTPGERPSLASAFRAAFRPVNLREDLAYLPKLLIDRSVWLPILLTIGAGVAFAVTGGANALIAIIATYFVAPPALGSVFIGGFLAPRASYLVGLIVGFVAAVVASVIIVTSQASLVTSQPIVPSPSPTPSASNVGSAAVSSQGASVAPSGSTAPEASPTPVASPSPTPSSSQLTPAQIQDQIVYAFATSPFFGLFFASSAAWYRRFLRLSRPTPPRQQQRRSDGRTRARK
jgi:hypothetical protein